MPVFFIRSSQRSNDTITIGGPLFSHLSKSLRVQTGETLWVGDEHRVRYHVQVNRVDSQSLCASILESIHAPPIPPASVVLAQAVLKGERMNWVIQKATELGVSAIIPLLTSRVIVRPPADRIRLIQGRWQRIVIDAAQQSEQWTVPDVASPMALAELFDHGTPDALRCALVERDARQRLGALPINHGFCGSLVLIVGPEGGWTREEVQNFRDHHVYDVSLGDHVFRGETAALAALSIIHHRLGNVG